MSAALQMGLGAALAGELSGDGVRVRARECVSVNCCAEPPFPAFLFASHFPLSLSSIQVGFPHLSPMPVPGMV